LSLPKQRRESARKFLRGKRPIGDGLLPALARAVVADGFLPEGADDLVTRGLSFAITNWNHVVGNARATSGETLASAAARFIRLAAIDFAIRAAALDVLAATSAPPLALDDGAPVPAWARARGVRSLLRALPRSLGITRASLSPRNRFDEIFDGRNRPSNAKLRQFCSAIEEHDAHPGWQPHILWAFALDALCNQLATIIGRDTVEDIGSAFRRVRTNTRAILLEVRRQPADAAQLHAAFARLAIAGAHAPRSDGLIDILVRGEAHLDEALAAVASPSRANTPSPEELSRRAAWATDVRAARADWLLAQLDLVARAIVPSENISLETGRRIAHALRAGADPGELAAACNEPAAMLWMARVVIQQAFVRGDFEHVLPMIARFAEVAREPALYFETAIVHAAAGRLDEVLHYVDVIGDAEPFATAARPLAAFARAMSGRADALQQLDALDETDPIFDYARGVALRGRGRTKEAVAVFENILADDPSHALAHAQAAQCCDELADLSRDKARARWRTRANRHARIAAHLGLSIGRTRRERTCDA
jgi:hypothetical protein